MTEKKNLLEEFKATMTRPDRDNLGLLNLEFYHPMSPEEKEAAILFIQDHLRQHNDGRAATTLAFVESKASISFLIDILPAKDGPSTRLAIAESIFDLSGDPQYLVNEVGKALLGEDKDAFITASSHLSSLTEHFTLARLRGYWEAIGDKFLKNYIQKAIWQRLGRIPGPGDELNLLVIRMGSSFAEIREKAVAEFYELLAAPHDSPYAKELVPGFQNGFVRDKRSMEITRWANHANPAEYSFYEDAANWLSTTNDYQRRWFLWNRVEMLEEQNIHAARFLVDFDFREALPAFKECLDQAEGEFRELILEGIGKWDR